MRKVHECAGLSRKRDVTLACMPWANPENPANESPSVKLALFMHSIGVTREHG